MNVQIFILPSNIFNTESTLSHFRSYSHTSTAATSQSFIALPLIKSAYHVPSTSCAGAFLEYNRETIRLLDDDPYCQIVIATVAFANGINSTSLLDNYSIGAAKTMDQIRHQLPVSLPDRAAAPST
ncbi:hypothetical protein ARMGADRAFT_1077819 [Armillaria gallica]|uniref:Uncharacterized protein n=1 Tax=Armillaria gallica TaxID=47427 RepID=A0A2H3DIL8_ARMGA|nr:hypothetical protein ARMGADRAFT_1077819 [Armillaria gallica]